jgi:hypothetical protein
VPGGSNEVKVAAFASACAPEALCWPYNCKPQTRRITPTTLRTRIEALNRIFIPLIELTATAHSSQRNCHVRSVEQPAGLFSDPADAGRIVFDGD